MTKYSTYARMLAAVQAFHDKHKFRENGGEDLTYRVSLMAEELGEISACVTKGKSKDELAEECRSIYSLDGTAIAADLILSAIFGKRWMS